MVHVNGLLANQGEIKCSLGQDLSLQQIKFCKVSWLIFQALYSARKLRFEIVARDSGVQEGLPYSSHGRYRISEN